MGNPWSDLTDDSWRHGGDEGAIAVVIREGIFGSCPDNPELTGEQADALARYVKELGRAKR